MIRDMILGLISYAGSVWVIDKRSIVEYVCKECTLRVECLLYARDVQP